MTDVITAMIPDGLAAAPGLVFQSEPGTGLYRIAANRIGFAVNGTKVGEINANGLDGGLQVSEISFTETAGAGTYTGSVALPAGATLFDIIVNGVSLWDAATSATLKVGDGSDDDGYYTGVNLKATDLLAGESLSFALAGGKAGAYIANSQVSPRYSATARTISVVVTTVGGSGTAGRTRALVMWAVPTGATVAASKA
jgi:hypothetical protein